MTKPTGHRGKTNMLLRNIFEDLSRTGQGKAAVVGWGRGMGHKGHMFLASSVITQAKELGADPYFVVSRTVGKDDPINPKEKLAIYKKVFPQSGHIFQTATEEMPDLTRVLAKLNEMGYTAATVVVGADQVKALSYVKNYNGKPNKSGNIPFNFNTLNVISRQETKDPSRDQEGPRATPMRAVLMDPAKSEEEKFAVWRNAMNPELSDDEVRDLMNKAEQRMKAMTPTKKGKVAEARMSAAAKLSKAWDQQRAKSDASLKRTPSSIPKKEEPKKTDQNVGENINQADYTKYPTKVLIQVLQNLSKSQDKTNIAQNISKELFRRRAEQGVKETPDGGSYAVNKPGYSGEANYTAQPNWRGQNIGENWVEDKADALARLIESQLK